MAETTIHYLQTLIELIMKKNLLLFLLILNLNASSQIKYEQGYFITDAGAKINCLIKNVDWEYNPGKFLYKLQVDSEVKAAKIIEIKEFGILNGSKYKRFNVDIDKSSNDLKKLSDNPEPEFSKEELFLKTLVEGKATLFGYKGNGVKRFFYGTSDSTVTQLIYKKYKVSETLISENNAFRKQLRDTFLCREKQSDKYISQLRYNESDLKIFFLTYNNCDSSISGKSEKGTKGHSFNLNFRPGINTSSLSITSLSGQTNFGNKVNVRFGLESEFILHFNKNKWAILVEPIFQYFKSSFVSNNKIANVDYKSIDISAGVRHYLFFSEKSKLFINVSYSFAFPFSSKIAVENTNLSLGSTGNGSLGMGYKYNKCSLELRYGFSRNLLGDYLYRNSDYKIVSAIFGYKLF